VDGRGTYFLHAVCPHLLRFTAYPGAYATRGTAYGLHTFATSLGSAVGPLVGGWVYDTWGHTTPFVLTGVTLLASLAWVPLLLRRQLLGGAPHHDEPRAVSP
jgi:predicted MFS family arabinose efflux permease